MVFSMKWEEVKLTYPNKFVKLQILETHIEGNEKYIDDMAVIKVINDDKEATKELIHCDHNTIVYHTGNESIFVEIKNIRGYRGVI
jgi:hypothetical protein